MSETVSVVIANYNMAKFIEQAIRSVLDQTRPPIEVIVVDDGSTDDSRNVIQGVAARDSRVIVIEQANAGQTRAKNVGLAATRGSIVGFCDADDYWLPGKLEGQLPLFDKPEVALVFTRARWIDLSGATLTYVPQRHSTGRVLEHLIVENFIPFGTVLVRREAFNAVGGFNERYRMGIDWEAWLRLARHYEFAFLDAVTYIYRVWDGQMSTDSSGRLDAALRIMDDFIAEYPGAVSQRARNRAYADTYANRALWRAHSGGSMISVAGDLWRAIRATPLDGAPWKMAAKCLVHRS